MRQPALRLDEKAALLRALPAFALFEPEAIHVLAFSATPRRLAAGDLLFRIGEASVGGFLIAEGRIALNVHGDTALGGEELSTGALVGEAALIAETTWRATAIALEPSVALVLPRAVVHDVLEAHPGSAARLRAHVADRLAGIRETLASLV